MGVDVLRSARRRPPTSALAAQRWWSIRLRRAPACNFVGVFQRLRALPPIGRAADWGWGPGARLPGYVGGASAHRRAEGGGSVCLPTARWDVGRSSTRGQRASWSTSRASPRSPMKLRTLWPKGSASPPQLVQQPGRLTDRPLPPAGRDGDGRTSPLETAMGMIADRLVEARERGWQDTDREGRRVELHAGVRSPWRRRARQRGELPHQKVLRRRRRVREPGAICHSTVPGLGAPSEEAARRPSSRTWRTRIASLIMGSNFAETHPVGFRCVMKARERGATIVHVDPRFTRTSACSQPVADPRRHRHRLPRRPDPLRARERGWPVLQGVRPALHQRTVW